MVIRLKTKTRVRNELPDYEYNGAEKKKAKIRNLKEDDGDFEDSTEEVVPTGQKIKLLPEKSSNGVGKLLSASDYDVLTKFNESIGTSDIIWQGSAKHIYAALEDVVEIMREKNISSNLIDSLAEILMTSQDKRSNVQQNDPMDADIVKAYIFPSNCWTYLVKNKETLMEQEINVKFREAMRNRSTLLLFPINTNRKMGAANHWTLLVLETETGDWKFYNSMLPRDGHDDPYNHDAENMIQYNDAKLITMRDSPQQQEGTLDCGVIVCHLIEELIEGKQINRKLAKGRLMGMRKNMISSFLNDSPCTWKEGKSVAKKKATNGN